MGLMWAHGAKPAARRWQAGDMRRPAESGGQMATAGGGAPAPQVNLATTEIDTFSLTE